MKKVVLSVVAALAVSAAPAFAADMPAKAAKIAPVAAPSPWDLAFGSAVMSDYVWRGITQSGHQPSVAAYFEPRYNINSNWQLYAGISGESIQFANSAAAEIDLYGGVRGTFGPLVVDVGYWYYYYPGGSCWGGGPLVFGGDPRCFINTSTGGLPLNGNATKAVASFYELYAKATYTAGDWAFGPTFYYTPNYLNTGADGEYLSGIVKWTAPTNLLWYKDIGLYVSGEFGHQWLGTSDPFYGTPAFPTGVPYADYDTWNVGLGFTWKVFTLDLRYSDTNLSKADCNVITSDPGASLSGTPSPTNPFGAQSKWCGAAFIAKLSADLTLGSLK
jgi:hypothetical protein